MAVEILQHASTVLVGNDAVASGNPRIFEAHGVLEVSAKRELAGYRERALA
jgi:hypothetical protein